VRGPAHLHKSEMLREIMMACIILHNMITKDEQDLYLGTDAFDYEQINEIPLEPPSHEHTVEFLDFIQNHHALEIEKLILNSSWTLSSIYGKYMTNKNF
jgi:hypothetical protein